MYNLTGSSTGSGISPSLSYSRLLSLFLLRTAPPSPLRSAAHCSCKSLMGVELHLPRNDNVFFPLLPFDRRPNLTDADAFVLSRTAGATLITSSTGRIVLPSRVSWDPAASAFASIGGGRPGTQLQCCGRAGATSASMPCSQITGVGDVAAEEQDRSESYHEPHSASHGLPYSSASSSSSVLAPAPLASASTVESTREPAKYCLQAPGSPSSTVNRAAIDEARAITGCRTTTGCLGASGTFTFTVTMAESS